MLEPIRKRTSPIYLSLTIHRQLFGVPQKLFFINSALFSFPILSFHMFILIPVFVLVHVFFLLLWRSDNEMIDIYLKYRGQTDEYTPWSHHQKKRRPEGFHRLE